MSLNFHCNIAKSVEEINVKIGPVDRHEIVKHKSVEELNAQLVSLVGENGAELLVGALRSRRSISGPELTK